jgi:hypothetical protein
MFCGECGTQNPDTNQFCKECGKPLAKNRPAAPVPQAAAVPAEPDEPLTAASPQAAPAAICTAAASAPAPATAAIPSASSGNNNIVMFLGVGSILASLISWFSYPYLLGFLAIVLGAIAIRKSAKKSGGASLFGILGILIGLVSVLFNIFYLDIFPPEGVALLVTLTGL